jgi:pyruvate/2-oxoacid:ferredoxin oxidoreductase alpha subunit
LTFRVRPPTWVPFRAATAFISLFRVRHFHETEAARAAGIAIVHDADAVTDAFCHAMKAFTTARDFRIPNLTVLPGRLLSAEAAQREEILERMEYENDVSICEELDRFDRYFG